MNILFISHEMIGGNLTRLLREEGHNVRLFIDESLSRRNFDNIIQKTTNWKKDLKWVGKEGLIIFDDTGYGQIQDKLRSEGYTVFGGSELGDRLEMDREYGQKIFAEYGLKTVPLKDFVDIRSAINYVKRHRRAWVIKQNNHGSKNLSYVGVMPDGRDVVSLLETYEKHHTLDTNTITLHQKIEGVEIGVGRYFNGTDWVGPIEYNVEHIRLFPGDTGPITSEMGTLAWYADDEKEKLYRTTLARMKPFLQKINFRGDFEINSIVNAKGAFPLEATARLGSPIVHLQSVIHTSPWGDFLHAVASGKQYDLKWKNGYGVVILVAVPPFPYTKKMESVSLFGMNIYFDKTLADKDWKHIHLEEVALRDENSKQHYISDTRGYVMYVTGMGRASAFARAQAHEIISKIRIPQMFYRNDIGVKFERNDLYRLKQWGYLKEVSDII